MLGPNVSYVVPGESEKLLHWCGNCKSYFLAKSEGHFAMPSHGDKGRTCDGTYRPVHPRGLAPSEVIWDTVRDVPHGPIVTAETVTLLSRTLMSWAETRADGRIESGVRGFLDYTVPNYSFAGKPFDARPLHGRTVNRIMRAISIVPPESAKNSTPSSEKMKAPSKEQSRRLRVEAGRGEWDAFREYGIGLASFQGEGRPC